MISIENNIFEAVILELEKAGYRVLAPNELDHHTMDRVLESVRNVLTTIEEPKQEPYTPNIKDIYKVTPYTSLPEDHEWDKRFVKNG